ncbi:N-acetyl-gamma-glutamyl-phosphate reductase, partial [bacterium]|nr:N-acetyl-gamma-glutamyl-phosphate reductase [bacterium]
MKTKVSIIGATGYTGYELVKILVKHPKVELKHLAVRREEKPLYSEIFPALKGVCDIRCSDSNSAQILKDSDVIFFALPHKITMTIMPEYAGKGKKIIDLSADYRLKDVLVYNEAYKHEHEDVENLGNFVYGLPEINPDEIKKANNIANPGCFPTSIILGLYPLIKEGIINLHNIIVDSKTGVSGGGRTPNLAFHFPECNESVRAYKVGLHQHEPEIEQELTAITGETVDVIFVPHLIPMTRGILSTIYADFNDGCQDKDISAMYKKYYGDKSFIRLCGQGSFPETINVSNTNFCDIGWQIVDQKIIVVTAIDNLIKGASGQAVQNMNVMLGLPET